jgi:hypothetical protein
MWKKAGSGFDAVMAVIATVPAIYHMAEQGEVPSSIDRTQAYFAESANLCLDFSRIAACGVVWSPDAGRKAQLAKGMAALMLLYGALEIAEVLAEASRPLEGAPPPAEAAVVEPGAV